MSVENVENDELDDEYDDDTSSQLGTLSLRNSLPTGHYLEENVGKGYNTATARRLRKVVLGKLWRLEQRRTGSFQVFISRDRSISLVDLHYRFSNQNVHCQATV